MPRPSKFPEIKALKKEHPKWDDEKIALKVPCSVRTVQRYNASIEVEVIVNDDIINDKIKKSNLKSQPPTDFIDDPNELLMSVAIRELNRANPDPRWASILISCKKENISNKSEVLDQFNQLPTQALVNLLSKSLQEEH